MGGIPAIGGGVEHQGFGTPHFHFDAHVVCIYQYGTLQEIADKIKNQMLDPASVKRYQQRLHCEGILDNDTHTEFLPRVHAE